MDHSAKNQEQAIDPRQLALYVGVTAVVAVGCVWFLQARARARAEERERRQWLALANYLEDLRLAQAREAEAREREARAAEARRERAAREAEARRGRAAREAEARRSAKAQAAESRRAETFVRNEAGRATMSSEWIAQLERDHRRRLAELQAICEESRLHALWLSGIHTGAPSTHDAPSSQPADDVFAALDRFSRHAH